MLEDHDWIRVTDRGFHKSLRIFGGVGGYYLETGAGGEPCGETLGVLGCGSGGVSVGSAEDDGAGDVTGGHVVLFGGGVYDLVDGLSCRVFWLCAGDGMVLGWVSRR